MDKPKNQIQIRKLIRDLGVKVTTQRLTIFEFILKHDQHMTAQEVFEHVRGIDNSIGFATVYRFLRTLTDNSLLTEVRMKGLPARYEWAHKKHHDHMSCTKCSKIVEFTCEEIENLQFEVSKKHGFKLTDHILELYGICPECQIEERIPKIPLRSVEI